ncbi:MAG: 30S ribosomal protein S16 [Candidatus Taylorbacteria bacterium RIFCSPLOWO2_12_FULL_47_20]|uniref:Small ribosomal subunit protein bS16 n=2 Tax=Candidatus Tayloriibacteriota TaxID=1817919 RepID=A0A1G2P898_9BACT|nr:MAG: 30S ribosomal protein S16 [Candidatus Taylorbacteria bacterium RIFCSPLOWO2_02_FULL_46_40]OHA44576.1 MAG: 30S ribosomal protein S16 [Candidatus Taylorbacteria bacterium RIFCSPLOWO2_12_FULL_47_20]
MLMIRLQRVGRKNIPTFRVVLTDRRNSTKSGKFLEVLGNYDPRQKGEKKFNAERIKHWLSVGAKTSGTVHNLLVDEKVVEGKKMDVLPKKTVGKKTETGPETATAQEKKGAEMAAQVTKETAVTKS